MSKPANLKIATSENFADRLADELTEREEAPSLERAPAPQIEPTESEAPISRRETATGSRDIATASATPRQRGRSVLRSILMLGGIAGVIILGGSYWLRGGRWVSTDDAYVRAPKLMVSTDISGIVASINVVEGQHVNAGDILFRVDPRQFEIALETAKAQLALVTINLTAAKSDYLQLQSGIAAQQAQVSLAQVNNDRAGSLVLSSAGSKAAFDQTRFALDAAREQLAALKRQSESALTRLGGRADLHVEQHPQHKAAQAAVDEVQRQLDHTVVRAPFGGTVTAVDKLQPGTYLVSQTAALTNTGAVALVADEGLYIEANVKETDLTFMKVGDPVDIAIDAYPDRTWKGHVDSISPASGSEFAIIPSQNASGNWVKVVQRVPIRLKIDQSPDNSRLRSGMSVVADVDTGHKRQWSDLWPWSKAAPIDAQGEAHGPAKR
jgi:membrane fusion protein (multidrug efflux system)